MASRPVKLQSLARATVCSHSRKTDHQSRLNNRAKVEIVQSIENCTFPERAHRFAGWKQMVGAVCPVAHKPNTGKTVFSTASGLDNKDCHESNGEKLSEVRR